MVGQRLIESLESEIQAVDQQLQALRQRHPVGQAQDALLPSVPGVGPVLARVLLAELPELGQLKRQEVAAWVGVAPRNRDSGQYRGPRTVGGGRAQVRATRYMATLSAIRRRPTLRACYPRLCARGKPRQVALIATMRKLLVLLNAILRTQIPWQEGYHTASSP